MKRKFIVLTIISIALILSIIIGTLIIQKGNTESIMATTIHIEAETDIYPFDEDSDSIEFSGVNSGDSGADEDIKYDIYTSLEIDADISTPEHLISLALSYNGKIPYAPNGRYWLLDYPIFLDGIDNRLLPADMVIGLDSKGYVIWLFRNVFGICDPLIETPTELYKEYQVNSDSLQVGDIGMLTINKNEKNHIGVCIGYFEDVPIFSHCDSYADINYPCGNTRISYLKSYRDEYFLCKPPVDFQYFIRLPLWEDNY